jgi:LysR family transcriptional regulator, transcriptional activator for bauABCD operon
LNQALREHRVDIAIRGNYSEDREFNYLPLFTETHRVYASKLASASEARGMPLVVRSHPYVDKALATGRYQRGPEAGGLEAIGVFIATGHYQGLLPTQYGDLLAKRYSLRLQPGSPAFSHSICAVTDPAHPFTHRAERFLDILAELHTTSRPGKKT